MDSVVTMLGAASSASLVLTMSGQSSSVLKRRSGLGFSEGVSFSTWVDRSSRIRRQQYRKICRVRCMRSVVSTAMGVMTGDNSAEEQLSTAEVPCSLPVGLHPAHKAVTAACDAWMLSELAEGVSERVAQFLLDCRLSFVCCRNYPASCPPDRLLRIAKLVVWMTLADDHDDHPEVLGCNIAASRRRHAHIMSILRVRPPGDRRGHDHQDDEEPILYGSYAAAPEMISKVADDGPTVRHADCTRLRALAQIWGDITRDMPPAVQRRFIKAYREALEASDAQTRCRVSIITGSGRHHDVEDDDEEEEEQAALQLSLPYISDLRRPASLYAPCFVLLEYALDMELHPEIVQHPLFAQLCNAAADHCCLTNDVFSYRVELAAGDRLNHPYILSRIRSISIPDAVQEIIGMLQEKEREFLRIFSRIEQNPHLLLDKQPEFRKYVDGLASWMSGMIKWSTETARYRQIVTKHGDVLSVLRPCSPD